MQLRRRLHLVKAAAHARQFAFPDAAEASARAAALHAQLQRVADDGEAYFKRPVVKGAVDGAGERAQKKLEDCSIRLRYAEQGDPLFIVADGHGVAADIDMLRKCVALLWGTKGRADPGGVSVAVQGAWRRASRAGAPLTCLNHTAVHSREETTAERASAVLLIVLCTALTAPCRCTTWTRQRGGSCRSRQRRGATLEARARRRRRTRDGGCARGRWRASSTRMGRRTC